MAADAADALLPDEGPSGPVRLEDPTVFAAVYDAHAATVLRIALGVLGDRQQAEDVTADVFLELWRRPGRFDAARSEMGTYLKLLARSRALDAWRRSGTVTRTRERFTHELGAGVVHAEDACTAAERATRGPALRAALQRLPDAQRHTITLAYWGGLSAAEIAERSGTPLGTVKGRLRLGLARLASDADAAAAFG